MNKWIEAIGLDILQREDQQKLSKEEKINYSLYLAVICFAIAIAGLFWHWGIVVIFGAIGARKIAIYWNKRKQYELSTKE